MTSHKYDVVVVEADDHYFIDGSADEAEVDKAHVWGFGVVTRKTKTGLYLGSAGAKFKAEKIGAETMQTSTHFFRKPYAVRKVGTVEL